MTKNFYAICSKMATVRRKEKRTAYEEGFNSGGVAEDENIDLSLYARTDLKELETKIENSPFTHGLTVMNRTNYAPKIMVTKSTTGRKTFLRLKVDTGGRKSSIFGMPHYEAYYHTFRRMRAIRPCTRMVKGIAGKREADGVAVIKMLLKDRKMLTDVPFIILSGDVPTLLTTKELPSNGLEISIPNCVIAHGGRRKNPEMIELFLVYRWQPEDLSYAP